MPEKFPSMNYQRREKDELPRAWFLTFLLFLLKKSVNLYQDKTSLTKYNCAVLK